MSSPAPISRFIEPLDVLFLRGNQLFGEPGSYGEALMPPWPSVAAGALRTRILADDGTLHADGHVVAVWISRSSGRPVPLPAAVRRASELLLQA